MEHCYLWSVAFGFHPEFIKYIKVRYSDVESMLKKNGNLCVLFRVYRCIREEFPLSGALYTLAIQPLLVAQKKKIAWSVYAKM